jgi:hypothetical protein
LDKRKQIISGDLTEFG